VGGASRGGEEAYQRLGELCVLLGKFTRH
jgi:hypothetical protein